MTNFDTITTTAPFTIGNDVENLTIVFNFKQTYSNFYAEIIAAEPKAMAHPEFDQMCDLAVLNYAKKASTGQLYFLKRRHVKMAIPVMA